MDLPAFPPGALGAAVSVAIVVSLAGHGGPPSAAPGADQVRPPDATATLVDESGDEIGVAELRGTADGSVLVRLRLTDAPPGDHAFHVHETGRCEPDFSAAGGHYAPRENDHGFLHEGGPHAGDLPNLHIGEDGALELEVLAPHLAVEKGAEASVFDEDGSAFILHDGADDYASQPSGDAGPEVACGVIR